MYLHVLHSVLSHVPDIFLPRLFIVGYFIILINIPIRSLEWGYVIDSTTYSIATCKIVTFLLIWMKYVG